MRAEVIAIGDELTSGQRLDTNSQWLSQQLGELGFATQRHTTIGDDLEQHVNVLRQVAKEADIVICTGGLGPTADDLTRQAMAEAFERRLKVDAASLKHIQEMFARRQRPMPDRNRLQAMFPEGSLVIPNPHGSAPGIELEISDDNHRCCFYCLPGVPAEMKQMWTESVSVSLEKRLGMEAGSLRYHCLKLFGIGESDVEDRLPELIQRQRDPLVGITVSRATITLRISARARSDDQFRSMIAPTIAEIEDELGDLIFGHGDLELHHVIASQLDQLQLSMASVEIGAASWVSDWMLTAAPPERNRYRGGLAFPNLAAAIRWLDTEDTPDSTRSDADDRVWSGLAEQCRARFATDVALVVAGYPPQEQIRQAGEAFDFAFVLATPGGSQVNRRSLGGHPDVLGPRAAKTGLDLLRRSLAELRQAAP